MDKKQCSKCKRCLLISDFYRSPISKDGYCSSCKDCARIYQQAHRKEGADRSRHYRMRHHEKAVAVVRAYQKAHPDKVKEWQHRNYLKHKEQREEWRQKYLARPGVREASQLQRRLSSRVFRSKVRQETLAHYSNGTSCCLCCNECDSDVLSVDHINGGGRHQRQLLKLPGGWQFYLWLQKQNYPDGYRVLCHNCNWKLHLRGQCHTLSK